MKVIAIDPGYDRIGVAILEKNTAGEQLIFSNCITTDKTQSINDRVFSLGQAIEKLLQAHQPKCLAIETLFFNKNTKTAINVAEARGVIIFLAKKYNCEVFEFGPQEIKVAITGYGKSDKTAVIAMTKRLVQNVPNNALDDEYDAIAIGVTCLAYKGNDR